MIKRLVAAFFVSALTISGTAVAADAAPKKKAAVVQGIDWDSYKWGGGGAVANGIDWD